MRNDGFLGNHTRIFTLPKHGIDPGKHARAQLQLPVVNAASDADRAAIGVNQRVNRLHLCRVFAARQGVNIQHGCLTPPDLALKTLRQPEVHEDGFEIFNIDNVCAVLEVVAHIDLANTHSAIERRNNSQAGCCGLRQRQLGLRYLQIGSTFIQ